MSQPFTRVEDYIYWKPGRSAAELAPHDIEGGPARRLWLNGIEVDESHTQLQRAYDTLRWWNRYERRR